MNCPPENLELAGPLVLLRPLRANDAPAVLQAVRESLDELIRWMPWCHPDYSLEECSQWIAAQAEAWRTGREFALVMLDRQSGAVVGVIGLNQVDDVARRANLGYWVRSSAARRGLATAAARALAEYALTALGLERIEVVSADDNVASQRVALKAGAVREGTARRRLRVHEQQFDAHVYSFVRDDLRKSAT